MAMPLGGGDGWTDSGSGEGDEQVKAGGLRDIYLLLPGGRERRLKDWWGLRG